MRRIKGALPLQHLQRSAKKKPLNDSPLPCLVVQRAYEQKFSQEQMKRFGLQEKKELIAKRRELNRAKQRVTEIDCIIQKSYEDMTKGVLSEERFATLTLSLENEQKQLKASIPEMENSLKTTTDKECTRKWFFRASETVSF